MARMVKDKIWEVVLTGVRMCGLVPTATVCFEHPDELSHGDYACNVALQLAKDAGKNPRELAEEIVAALPKNDLISKTEVAGPGFINITLSSVAISKLVDEIGFKGEAYGTNTVNAGKRIMYEYTDPNPLKVFHIGHLMSNAIGEALARLAEQSGATVIRANYQGDVGLHIAKAVFGMRALASSMPRDDDTATAKTAWLGEAYVLGAKAYEEGEKEEIVRINKALYEGTDSELSALMEEGKRWSIAHFEDLYGTLGTTFDHYYFESQVSPRGLALVTAGLEQGIFERSDGAIVFKGEDEGLHTRVFVNALGIPTYEAKELGVGVTKFEEYPDLDRSYLVTGNEIVDYMKVVLHALGRIAPEVAARTIHVPHGMMLGADGKKFSSRKGGVVSGEGLLEEMRELARERVREARPETPEEELETIATRVAVAAIKYQILKQGIGKNIVFDRERALSFEGDSGPYLLYTYARARSVLRRGKDEGLHQDIELTPGWETTELERRLYWLPDVIERAAAERAPNMVATYLTELAQTFNTYYGNTKIADTNDPASPYRLALTAATAQVLKNGLASLGIETSERM